MEYLLLPLIIIGVFVGLWVLSCVISAMQIPDEPRKVGNAEPEADRFTNEELHTPGFDPRSAEHRKLMKALRNIKTEMQGRVFVAYDKHGREIARGSQVEVGNAVKRMIG